MKRILLIVVLLVVVPINVVCAFTGNTLLSYLEDGEQEGHWRSMAMGYITGVSDFYQLN